MTRQDVLSFLVRQARGNGFAFRKWFAARIGEPWTGFDDAIATLSSGNRYYALLFSHDFARHFWMRGTPISFVVPRVEYTRRNPDGSIATIRRKAYTRRTAQANAWIYHLKEMAATEEPLRYIRRFLVTDDELREWNRKGGPSEPADS